MVNARIERAQDLDGTPRVLACFDLSEAEFAAAAHAVAAVRADRFRIAEMSSDDVLAMRELTAVADELADRSRQGGAAAFVVPPARLNALHDALAAFVESRDFAEWIREEDREPLALVRGLVWPLEDLGAEALRAALESPAPRT